MENLKLKKVDKIVIACDGGASSGKTTGAKLISRKYNLEFLSSGLLYRYAAFLLLKNKHKKRIFFLRRIFKKLSINKLKKINLHTQEIDSTVSIIAKEKKIRLILKKYQINFAKKNNKVCIEGRDISYAILPSADIKFFFLCKDLNIAARRRWKELRRKNKKIKFKEVKKSLKMRNFNDKNRRHNPLIKLPDSIVIRTDVLNKSQMIKKMSKIIDFKVEQKYGIKN